MMITIDLPFPNSKLSGHNTGHWRAKADIVAKHRKWARLAVLNKITMPETGDIYTKVIFYPPDNRGDRLNYPNRMKPYFDGMAEGLGVNDKRFDVPQYEVMPIEKPGRVVIKIMVD